ncbi:MAG: glycosyltransferase family 2 protein [Candidatus Omnitrophica bacterium]|nr:glycosyltransferase family 2 protein [Candidatus Omnitrophota bacterium]
MVKKKRSIEWPKFLGYLFFAFMLPVLLFVMLGIYFPGGLNGVYYFVIVIFVFQASISYLQTCAGFRRKMFRQSQKAEDIPVPKTTFLVTAYLPNELDVVEDTLLNILKNTDRPEEGIEVILDYNTPHVEEIETRLRNLAYQWPELILANAYHSRSKSENLNYALDIASGELVVMLDADHIVAHDCIKRAWRWIRKGYDVVQGRCKVRNGKDGVVSTLVEVEFEAIYGISHYAKSLLFDAALFGGSNGYWKASVIKSLKFEKDMLTEDIDITLRAILSGYKIVHDRSILSTELAPTTWGGLWHQRMRWAQGWFQCTVKHQRALLGSKYLSFAQRFWWALLLSYRVFYDVVAHMLVPMLLAYWIDINRIAFPMTRLIWIALFYTVLSGPFEAVAAYKNAASPRSSILRYGIYMIFLIPFTAFKNMVSVISIWQELRGEKKWVVSER